MSEGNKEQQLTPSELSQGVSKQSETATSSLLDQSGEEASDYLNKLAGDSRHPIQTIANSTIHGDVHQTVIIGDGVQKIAAEQAPHLPTVEDDGGRADAVDRFERLIQTELEQEELKGKKWDDLSETERSKRRKRAENKAVTNVLSNKDLADLLRDDPRVSERYNKKYGPKKPSEEPDKEPPIPTDSDDLPVEDETKSPDPAHPAGPQIIKDEADDAPIASEDEAPPSATVDEENNEETAEEPEDEAENTYEKMNQILIKNPEDRTDEEKEAIDAFFNTAAEDPEIPEELREKIKNYRSLSMEEQVALTDEIKKTQAETAGGEETEQMTTELQEALTNGDSNRVQKAYNTVKEWLAKHPTLYRIEKRAKKVLKITGITLLILVGLYLTAEVFLLKMTGGMKGGK